MAKTGRPTRSPIIGDKKFCPDCLQWLFLADFHNCRTGHGGKTTYCKRCNIKRALAGQFEPLESRHA